MAEVNNLNRSIKCSVLVPVYNGARFLDIFLENLIPQLEHDDELIIVNDGSTDMSGHDFEKLEELNESIRVINCEHKGLVETLNYGIQFCRGRYIARADVDDNYTINRIRLQKSFLDKNPKVVAVFSDYRIQGVLDQDLGEIPSGITPTLMKMSLIAANRTAHPSVMFRKRDVIYAGGYKDNEYPAEDLGLWTRLALIGDLASISENLLNYRLQPSGITSLNQSNMILKRDFILSNFAQEIDFQSEALRFECEFRDLKQSRLRAQRQLLSLVDLIKLMRYQRQFFYRTFFRLSFYIISRAPIFFKAYIQLKRDMKKRAKYRESLR